MTNALSNDYETEEQWSGRNRGRPAGMSRLETARWSYPRIYSCGWPFSDDDSLKHSQAFSLSIAETLIMTLITAELYVFVSGYLCSTVSFHYIMPSLMFRFLVPLLGYSTRVWVSILPLIFQLRARPGSSEAQTASIVSICTTWWWSHRQTHASLRSSALARLHQLRSCC